MSFVFPRIDHKCLLVLTSICIFSLNSSASLIEFLDLLFGDLNFDT